MNCFSLFYIGNITKLFPGEDEEHKSQTVGKEYNRQVKKMLFYLSGCYCEVFLIFQLFKIGTWA